MRREAPVPFAGMRLPEPPENPRWDPHWTNRILNDLLTHFGEWRALGRLHAAGVASFERCCVVREAVDKGRRLGFVIEGDRRRGYRLVGFAYPEGVYLAKPGLREQDAEPQIPGQLHIAGVV